jgi:hypothetical protein
LESSRTGPPDLGKLVAGVGDGYGYGCSAAKQ